MEASRCMGIRASLLGMHTEVLGVVRYGSIFVTTKSTVGKEES